MKQARDSDERIVAGRIGHPLGRCLPPLLPSLAIGLFLLAGVLPLAGAVEVLLTQPGSGYEARSPWQLLATSTYWAGLVALLAVVIGWAPGRWLGSLVQRGGFIPLAVFLLVPICLPAYVIFFAWWQSWPADTWLYRWAVEHQQVQLVRHLTLLLGMTCWSWPIVSWCVAASMMQTPAQREELLAIDGVSRIGRAIDRFRRDRSMLTLGGLIVFIATFNNVTCFDLAEIFTVGNELRAMKATGANERDVLVAALPAAGLTMFGAILIWIMLGSTRRHGESAVRAAAAGWSARVWTVVLWTISVAIPLGLLARNLWQSPGGRTPAMQWREFTSFYGTGLMNTVIIALITASCAVVIAMGLAWMWQDRRAWVRGLAHAQAIVWLILAAVPGSLIGVALIATYNRPIAFAGAGVDELIYRSPAILILGHVARYAFLGALFGRWMAIREPRSIVELRAMDGARRLPAWWRSARPRIMAMCAATFAIVLVMSLSEIPVTAMVRPPGFDAITTSILNDMHFQRPQTVMFATGIFFMLALIAACVTALLWRPTRRVFRVVSVSMLAIGMMLVLPGCGEIDPENVDPLRTEMTFGIAGRALGQFNYPRSIDIDYDREVIYIVDRSGRVQRFDMEGNPQKAWTLPDFELGQPTGITVDDQGRVILADTHYYRVLIFDHDGNELLRFGEYGFDEGQFLYTTRVGVGPEGKLYVGETGGNDRIQVFSPDGEFLFSFGQFGAGEGELSRPQGMAFNREKTRLYVADACNHRIAVYEPDGTLLRYIGEPGRGLGQLSYPYDVLVLEDESLLVVEFHNNRLQKFRKDGTPVGLYGRIGFRDGEVQYPWSVAGNLDRIYVVDSGNNRVQRARTP
ncbi:MAG: hypothetical protein EA377_04805 [Phycisphaerales bacterium]|nr:MAG: hypothetical protein EA377_04805 [Phycisphaerales bacterium]